MDDLTDADVTLKREADAFPEARMLKRKKTVTWADDELELPLPLPTLDEAVEAAAASLQAAGHVPPTSSRASEAQPAVAVLPCDRLFEGIPEDVLQQQEQPPPPAAEPLTRRQLLERRIAHTEQLAALYEGELWALLEELRLRHQQFVAQPGVSVWKQQGKGSADDSAALQQEESRAAADVDVGKGDVGAPGDGTSEADAAGVQQAAGGEEAQLASVKAAGQVGSRLRQLWERQQVAAAGAALVAQDSEAAEGAAAAEEQQQQQQQGPDDSPARQQTAAPPPVHFEDLEALILSGGASGLPPVHPPTLLESRTQFARRLAVLSRLEQGALGAACREMDAVGGLAVLCGLHRRYVLRRAAVAIGRSTDSQGKVDVDLSEEAPEAAHRISRQQAQLFLDTDGGFKLRCTGRRAMLVNGRLLVKGQAVALPTLSHIQAGGVSLLFVANAAAAARAARRAAQLSV